MSNRAQEQWVTHVDGHVHISDDLGNVLLDEHNAIHPQNMARVIARALANEPNYNIYRVALGNGGTTVTAGNTIVYKTPNDGQLPDPAGWQSRLYNETYSEVIDESSTNYGTGTGTVPGNDPTGTGSNGVRSTENGLVSYVTIDVTLNAEEPEDQNATDNAFPSGPVDSEYTFDELGLFTPGAPATNTPATQTINLENKNVNSPVGLSVSSQYTYKISVNGSAYQTITITTPAVGTGSSSGATYLTYGDIIPLMNNAMAGLGVTAKLTDTANGVFTQGNLVLTTSATGSNASVIVDQTAPLASNFLFNHMLGYVSIATPVSGKMAGVQNNAANPATERERLLTHIIFSPILKSSNRTIRIVYTLTISVARSAEA